MNKRSRLGEDIRPKASIEVLSSVNDEWLGCNSRSELDVWENERICSIGAFLTATFRPSPFLPMTGHIVVGIRLNGSRMLAFGALRQERMDFLAIRVM